MLSKLVCAQQFYNLPFGPVVTASKFIVKYFSEVDLTVQLRKWSDWEQCPIENMAKQNVMELSKLTCKLA